MSEILDTNNIDILHLINYFDNKIDEQSEIYNRIFKQSYVTNYQTINMTRLEVLILCSMLFLLSLIIFYYIITS